MFATRLSRRLLSGVPSPAVQSTGDRLRILKARLAEEAPSVTAFAAKPAVVEEDHSAKPDPPKPDWLKIQLPRGETRTNFERLGRTVKSLNLATVCEEAKCPNIGECWGGAEGTATGTIMLMGDTCTRGCKFCAVKTAAAPPPLDPKEPEHVAKAIGSWGLDYVVLTSVTRDDLPDEGSGHFAATVRHLKTVKPALIVECLTPDFSGRVELVDAVAASGLDVYAHNLETVERLQRRVRDRRAGYKQSLSVLERVRTKFPDIVTKTSLMLGVGETAEDIRATMRDCIASGVQVITFGQYLRPSKQHLPIHEYVTPAAFDAWREEAEAMGFLYVASGPLVRSSYKAGEFYLKGVVEKRRAAQQHQ